MPKEIIPQESDAKGPPEVYCSLRDLIGLQYDAHGFSFLPRHAVHSLLAGRHRSKLRGRGLDFDEVRKYVAGDDIRNIDWRVTARVGTTHTKVFTEERERPVLMIVDQSSSMFFGSQVYLKSVIAAHATALAAWRVLSVGDRVGGIVFDDHELDYVNPKRDRRSIQRLLSLVATKNQKLEPVSKETDENLLNRSLHHAIQVVSHDFLIILITDFKWANVETIKKMIQLHRHNDIIAVQVTDPLEAKLISTQVSISDGEFQTLVDKNVRIHKKFEQHYEERQKWLATQFKKYGMPYIQLNTMDTVSTQLRKLIGGQMQIKKRQ
jgi:uncharacterized protein (DUF58 family)